MARKLRRILVHIPKEFLKEFDEETVGIYVSRNEAIRAGMTLVLKEHSIVTKKARFMKGPLSERLVLGVIFATFCLFGLVGLQVAHLIALHEWNSEIFAAIMGLVGTIIGIILGQKPR